MGLARIVEIDTTGGPGFGFEHFKQYDFLRDKEVVLTFDDGPVPRHTSSVLETLASECTKATFFMVGQMANAYPAMVRRVHDEGHTIANHSQTHPFTFSRMSVEQAAAQIQGGFASLRAALGDPDAVAPFFRIPGLLRQDSVEQYLAAHGVMTWSVDAVADDWTHINAAEIARRAISRLEARGKGVLLLHDIHEKTALAFPVILKELKARGFKIVHVVPATPDRPKTVTAPEQWAVHTTPAQKLWPGVADIDMATLPAPALPVPSGESFGLADPPGRPVDVAWARSFPRPLPREGHLPAPISPWPSLIPPAPVEVAGLVVPAAENFQYAHLFALPRTAGAGAAVRKRTASAGPVRPKTRTQPVARGLNPFGGWTGTRAASPPRLFGHQL
jgi:peptidoglycan/xylan/chitin deacetylase (PgdA/CDA1 family)